MSAGVLVAVGALLAALASLAVIPAAPSYDPWMWLIWGRELSGGSLNTVDGPAVKPLPMLVAAVLSGFGDAAPVAWVVIARAGAIVGVVLAGVLVHQLTTEIVRGTGVPAPWVRRGSAAAAALAVLALMLTASTVRLAATGGSEGLLVAFAFVGLLTACGTFLPQGGRNVPRAGVVLGCALGCSLLRVEAWPFALMAIAPLWSGLGRGARTGAVVAALAVPALWFGLEWLGSGDPWRSGSRALTPEVGQPALAGVPFLASVRDAAALAWWPAVAGGVGLLLPGRRVGRGEGRAGKAERAQRVARLVAVAGLAWVGLVAAMAQVGFSGEPRYAWPGIVALTVAAVAGWVVLVLGLVGQRSASGVTRGANIRITQAIAPRADESGARSQPSGEGRARRSLPGSAVLAGVATLVLGSVWTGAARVHGLVRDRDAVRYQHALHTDLQRVIAAAGGRAAVVGCGRPVAGPRRGPMVAWRLRVVKEDVRRGPQARGVVLQSALTEGAAELPPGRGLRVVATVGLWTVRGRCPATVAR